MVTCSDSDFWLLCPPLSSAGTRRHRGCRSLSTLAARANRARLYRAGSSWRSKPRANGIIIASNGAVAGAEVAMIMEQHDESGVGKSLGEGFNALSFHSSIAVGHGDRRPWPIPSVRDE